MGHRAGNRTQNEMLHSKRSAGYSSSRKPVQIVQKAERQTWVRTHELPSSTTCLDFRRSILLKRNWLFWFNSLFLRTLTVKLWGVIFRCLTSKAVNLELTDTLDTEGTILAISRFQARRRKVKRFWSDNGTNLRSAEKEFCENLGLTFRLMASWWQFLFHCFSCFNVLKLDITISMAPQMISFDLVLYKLSAKVTLLSFSKGNKVFDFWIGILSKKSDNHAQPWNANHDFHGNQNCVKGLIFGRFQRNFTWMVCI